MAAGTDLIPLEERELRGLELAEKHFPMERRAQVAQFLDVPADSPALLPYLAWCASLNLSPIAGHVWLIPKKVKGRDGESDRMTYRPAIGRDGLLHKARETKGQPGGYRGLRANVVCEHDTFEVEDDGFDVKVLHRFAHKPTEFDEGVSPDRYRGRVIGAWAKCFIDGEPPTFFFANLREHGRLRQVWDWNPSARKRAPIYLDAAGKRTWDEFDATGMRHRPLQEWEGAWDYVSTMILKAAQSYVLRIGLGVTGVIPIDEMRAPVGADTGEAASGGGFVAGGDLAGEPDLSFIAQDDLRERFERAIETANEQEPFSWGPAKCEMVLKGRSDSELYAILEAIEQENDLREQRLAGESVVDAEVVEEKADAAPELTDEQREQADALRHREADLIAAQDEAEAGSEEMAQITAELDRVQAELKSLGAGE